MASAVVVLKHKNSTLRQRHNFISIDFKFGVGDYVKEVTSPAKFGLDSMSGRDTTVTFCLLFYSSTEQQLMNQFSMSSNFETVRDTRNINKLISFFK